jgi:hypothetical protein
MTLRAPLAVLGLMGLSAFASFLIISLFSGIGKAEFNFFD